MKLKNGCGKLEPELQYSTKGRPVRDQIYSYFVKYLENGVTYKTSLYRPVRSSDISTYSNQQFGWKYFSESQLSSTYIGQKWCKPPPCGHYRPNHVTVWCPAYSRPKSSTYISSIHETHAGEQSDHSFNCLRGTYAWADFRHTALQGTSHYNRYM